MISLTESAKCRLCLRRCVRVCVELVPEELNLKNLE